MDDALAPLPPQYLVLGEIMRPHGIRGEARLRLITENPDQLRRQSHIYLGQSARDDRPQRIKLERVRFHQNYALLTLEGFRDRSAADRLRGKLALLHVDDAEPLAEGEYYLFQLIGLTVLDGGRRIGVLREVLQTGANDVYIVDGDAGEVLLPAHEETLDSIDFEGGIIHMRLPDGLLAKADA